MDYTSTRNGHRGSHRAQPGMVTARQQKQNRINNPHCERIDNHISTEHGKKRLAKSSLAKSSYNISVVIPMR
jgi:hypothetical protein